MVEYRPIPDERDVFHEYRNYAFRPETGVPAYDPDEHETPRATLGARRGLYENPSDDRPRCVCRHYWLESRVRGERRATAGLASVATPPEYRREGFVRQLLAHALAEYRDHGIQLSVLWPFRSQFYGQYGWAGANRIVIHECDPEALSFGRTGAEPDRNRFRRLEADEYDAIEPVYEAWADRYALTIDRDEDWWRHRVFSGSDVDPFVYAVERDGSPRGYLVYTIDREDADRRMDRSGPTMDITELAFVDGAAFRALLSFCADHDSQVDSVRFRVPEATPLRATVRDPERIETTVETGPMIRLVDVESVLESLPYPDRKASLTIDVTDPLADWNDGTFAVDVASETARCDLLDEPVGDLDVRLDVGTLSQLAVGARSATDLDRLDRLGSPTAETIATLEALFPETDIYLGEFF